MPATLTLDDPSPFALYVGVAEHSLPRVRCHVIRPSDLSLDLLLIGGPACDSGEVLEPFPSLTDWNFEDAERDWRALLQTLHAVWYRQMAHEIRG